MDTVNSGTVPGSRSPLFREADTRREGQSDKKHELISGGFTGKGVAVERIFIGKARKYQIPHGAIVDLIKCWAKRKCLVRFNDKEFITFVSLLRIPRK